MQRVRKVSKTKKIIFIITAVLVIVFIVFYLYNSSRVSYRPQTSTNKEAVETRNEPTEEKSQEESEEDTMMQENRINPEDLVPAL